VIGGPAIVMAVGGVDASQNASSFRRYCGLAPRASETGNSDAKGQPMSKAGAGWLRDQLVMSANTARAIDPELARVYYVQMVERGAHHNKAVCVVASHLAEREWSTLRRGEPYILRDVDGTEITVADGKRIVAERYNVPEEVRRRRRTRKTAKTSDQTPTRHPDRDDPSRRTTLELHRNGVGVGVLVNESSTTERIPHTQALLTNG
jgi:Transposase IS116/IS110/IS902 family